MVLINEEKQSLIIAGSAAYATQSLLHRAFERKILQLLINLEQLATYGILHASFILQICTR